MKKALVITLLVGFVALPLTAAPLNKARVSAEANWVLHADYEAFIASTLGKLIREELKVMGVEEKLQSFKTVFTFHPLDDIRGVTIYGQGKDPTKAAAIIQGTFNHETLDALVRMNPSFQAVNYGNYVIDSWIDEKKPNGPRQYGVFHGTDLLLIGGGEDTIKGALDVLDGKATSIADNTDLADFERDHPGMFILIAAEKVNGSVGADDESGILQHTDRFALAIGEDDASAYIDATAEAINPEGAMKITQVLQGLIAFGQLSASEKPILGKIAQAVQVGCQDRTVRLHFDWDSKDLVAVLKQLAAMQEAAKQAAAAAQQ